MPRCASFLATFALVLISIAALVNPQLVIAQDSTPAASPSPEEEGVTFTALGFAPGVSLPAQGDLILVDLTLEPGAVSTFLETDPTGGMLYVEAGEFTVVNQTTTWSVTRGTALEEAMTSETTVETSFMEMIKAGEEALLAEGDVAYLPGSISGEIRNDSQIPARGIIFLIAPSSGTGMDLEGTPAP